METNVEVSSFLKEVSEAIFILTEFKSGLKFIHLKNN